MNTTYLLDNLNSKQRDAVILPRINSLVLAGAGSGKTRVLIHRIAWLQKIEGCPSCSIMAVTFTNKAATELRNRITKLTDINQKNMLIGTFHSLAYRLLRKYYSDAYLPQDFQIIDNDDQLHLIKRLIKSMNLNERIWSPCQIMWYINNQKDKGIRPHHISTFNNKIEEIKNRIYKNYQDTCNRSGLVDFTEILIRTYELCVNNSHILQYYQRRITNILIDEFQDTNYIQYALIRLLAGDTGKVMIVGDDDQSIYGWRGAQVENIKRFINDFNKVKIIRLERNYRSTNNILTAANALIEKNYHRLGKKLWTSKISGELISIYCAFNELDEATFVINQIKKWLNSGGNLSQCAILYRSNTQSRIFEDRLLYENIPYHISGGARFFERQEIKDVLSYLRLIINHNDDTALERIINKPTRGIGSCTINKVRKVSHDRQLTLWQSCLVLLQERILSSKIDTSLRLFIELIESLTLQIANLPLHIQINTVIQNSGLRMMYNHHKENQFRIENLEELITATRQFTYNEENKDNITSLQTFLSYATIDPDEMKVCSKQQDAVQLMTLHSSKGLEFSQVFIVGMEEGIFPIKSLLDSDLEEERRLAYVGLTRAMNKLTLTYSKTRRLHGKDTCLSPSRFVDELPKDCVKNIYLC